VVGVAVLHLGAIVFVKDVAPMEGTQGETKSRRVILLRKCFGPDDVLPCVVIKTLRGSLDVHEIAIPHRPDGHIQTSLTNPSAAVCCWVIHVSLDRITKYAGKCPPPLMAEVLRAAQRFQDESNPP